MDGFSGYNQIKMALEDMEKTYFITSWGTYCYKVMLYYFITTDIVMGALLTQYLEETRKENAIYYISKKILPYEEKYSPLEKTCVALVWATRKLKHYMLAYKVLLIARMDHLNYLMEKPVQYGKTTKWFCFCQNLTLSM